MTEGADDCLRFAERLLALLEATRYSATYKLATLLAILELVAEQLDPETGAPSELRGRQVAERVIELYWPQTSPYGAPAGAGPRVLAQSPQNDIPAKLGAWRRLHDLGPGASIEDARAVDEAGWQVLKGELVATVLGMPLAKLQRFGEGRGAIEDRFIYDFAWPDEVKRGTTDRADFDDLLRLRPNVGDWLVRLTPLLRPLIEAKWASRVAERNPDLVDRQRLDDFLFGSSRISLERIRGPLFDAQGALCFYCQTLIHRQPAVDHFLPWSRHPDNTIDNLVVAHASCNGAKSASLAGVRHLQRWLERFRPDSPSAKAVREIAELTDWPRRPDRTLGAARAIYLWLPSGTRMWVEQSTFEPLEAEEVRRLLAA